MLQALPLPVSFEDWCALFLLFIAYSTIGWCGEMVYCSVPKGRLCEKRGFLNGFLCPIYGFGALLVLYVLHGGFCDPLLTFLGGFFLTSALEYFTSWLMEQLFHMRWWDYSHYRFQLNGRVCLLNSTCFALACVALCHLVQPWLWGKILSLGSRVTVPLASFFFGIFLTDTALSVRSAIQLSDQFRTLQALQEEFREKLAERREELIDRTEALSARLREQPDIFERRLLHSHPDLKHKREELLSAIREHLHK